MTQIVSITSKGQATIPKELREKYGMKDKALVVDTDEGILFKPLPSPRQERGSLRRLLKDKTARELVEEARLHEAEPVKGRRT
ncbi:MAG: AbrB/MazE/SpoVT family DNA-binding domain-containing protein [Candidatus Bathyarchaeota archaeon]